jgi:hypothetical protein
MLVVADYPGRVGIGGDLREPALGSVRSLACASQLSMIWQLVTAPPAGSIGSSTASVSSRPEALNEWVPPRQVKGRWCPGPHERRRLERQNAR